MCLCRSDTKNFHDKAAVVARVIPKKAALGTRARLKFFKFGRPIDAILLPLVFAAETASVFDDILDLNYGYRYIHNNWIMEYK